PKRRPKSSLRARASHFALKPTKLNVCTQCGQAVAPHCACSVCGTYKGRAAVKVKVKAKKSKGK
ncbi:MAG TPA: 50S ribosomal protein L32, partial [Candidatus Methylomirabilis sp.]|nr:50S ribosomal protein L32 [Candidatus Methylomirabilis sp.]